MQDLSGKKLLIVSGDGNDLAFVRAAKEMGLYVVCCDGHEDWKYSPAKEAADEAWNINYAWTEAVAEKCRERGIDGVIAGYSESRVLAACRIARSLGTPFYATEEQIEWTRNKRWFKRMCAKHGVATPRDYRCDLPLSEEERQAIRYPVIIKPSDNGGRKGISICKSPEALDAAVALAEEQSFDGKIVIEEYVTGVELCAVYTISDGKISLSCLNDKYVCDDPIASTLCNVVLTPSKHYEMCIRDRSRSHPSTTPTWKWASSTWCCSNAAWPGWTRVPPRACCRRRNSSRPFRNGRVSTSPASRRSPGGAASSTRSSFWSWARSFT